MAELDENGHEVLDTSPSEIPIRFKRMETQFEQVQRLVHAHISQMADAQGFETFDEADDFDVEDDYDPRSRYELDTSEMLYDRNARWTEDEKEFIGERIRKGKRKPEQTDVEDKQSPKGPKLD